MRNNNFSSNYETCIYIKEEIKYENSTKSYT